MVTATKLLPRENTCFFFELACFKDSLQHMKKSNLFTVVNQTKIQYFFCLIYFIKLEKLIVEMKVLSVCKRSLKLCYIISKKFAIFVSL